MPKLAESVDFLKCPQCGVIADIDQYDDLGACLDNVFCLQCHCEFDPETRTVHKECGECMDAEEPWGKPVRDLGESYRAMLAEL
jgi:predicted RNA-binding Zn-ribbon protein involved in translation (DUF1610 family)